jgi:hypothetical protein
MNKKEKIVEGIILGIGIVVGVSIAIMCITLLTAFIQAVNTIL